MSALCDTLSLHNRIRAGGTFTSEQADVLTFILRDIAAHGIRAAAIMRSRTEHASALKLVTPGCIAIGSLIDAMERIYRLGLDASARSHPLQADEIVRIAERALSDWASSVDRSTRAPDKIGV